MLNYVKAEMYRLLHRRGNYTYWGITFALFILINIFSTSNMAESQRLSTSYFEMTLLALYSVGIIFIAGQAYTAVFIDDLSAKSLVNIFTTGMSKSSFIVAKFITYILYIVLIILAGAVVFFSIFGIQHLFVDNIGFDQEIFQRLILVVVSVFFGAIGYGGIINIVAFWRQKSTFTSFFGAFLMLGFFHTIIYSISRIPALQFFETIASYSLTSYLTQAMQTLTLPTEVTGGIDMSLIIEAWIVCLVYMLIAGAISVYILDKVEIKEEN